MKLKYFTEKNFLITVCFALCGIMLILSGCNTSSKDLYNYGLEMTTLMEEMVKDTNYTKIIGNGNYDLSNFIANDYDTPTNVFTITIPTPGDIFQVMFKDNDNNLNEKYQNLSPHLQEQLNKMLTFNSLIQDINFNSTHFEDSLIASYYYAQRHFKGQIKENIAYLYIFETGKPIIIIFENNNNQILATSYFLLLKQTPTLSSLRELFNDYKCNVNLLTK